MIDCDYGNGECGNKAEFILTFSYLNAEYRNQLNNYNRIFCLKHTKDCLDCDNFIKLERLM